MNTESNSPQNSSHTKSQPLVQHLIELRNCLLQILFLVTLIFAGLFYFANDIYAFVSEPIRDQLPDSSTMIATDITATFLAPFKLTFFVSVFAAIPYILYQFWSFIAPGLYRSEKNLLAPLMMSSVILFYAGIAVAYYAVLPVIFKFLTMTAPTDIQVMPDISLYLNLSLKLFFAFGVAFEIPIATVLLIWSGVTTPDKLAAKRPYIIVGCFFVGMLLTPPDVISQLMLAIPMWLLFEIGIVCGRMIKAKQRPSADDDQADR